METVPFIFIPQLVCLRPDGGLHTPSADESINFHSISQYISVEPTGDSQPIGILGKSWYIGLPSDPTGVYVYNHGNQLIIRSRPSSMSRSNRHIEQVEWIYIVRCCYCAYKRLKELVCLFWCI